MLNRKVEISSGGRAGSVYYREGGQTAEFYWEFAASPALAIVCGEAAKVWDQRYPWAAGRQPEIYDFVADEVVRQQAPGYSHEIDLDTGTITIVPRGYGKQSAANSRFRASLVREALPCEPDGSYDLAALAEMSERERKEMVALLVGRGVGVREVEALAVKDNEEARAAIDAASRDHLSIDTRLAAAEVMHNQGRLPDLENFLARQIRRLHSPADGVSRALRMAELRPSEEIRQALLWASYNATECAPACARLLLAVTGAAKEPFDGPVLQMLEKLGPHNNSFDRQAAFEQLCRRVQMELDRSTTNY